METKSGQRVDTRRGVGWKSLPLLAAASMALAACGGNGGEAENARSTKEPAATTDQTGTAAPSTPYPVRHEWDLPPREVLSPRTMTEEGCYEKWWRDEEGARRPLVQEDPPIARVDGRCNTPLPDEVVGIYPQPRQEGEPTVAVVNGDALGIECATTVDAQGDPAQYIQDIRGPIHGSRVWLGVVTADGKVGLIPEVNKGYADETRYRKCFE